MCLHIYIYIHISMSGYRLQVGRRPLGSSCCTVPGRCHLTGPPSRLAIMQSVVTGTVSGRIRLTEALARVGRPSQKDFKLPVGSPSSSCTVQGSCHRIGPPGRLAIIQSAVTVSGRIRLTAALERADRPSTRYLGVPFGTRKYVHKYIASMDICIDIYISI